MNDLNRGQSTAARESTEALFLDFQSIMREFRRSRPSLKLVPENLTPSEAFVVMFVGKASERQSAVTPGLIAEHIRTSKSSASQLLRSMEEKGLIVRTKSSADARTVVVTLSYEGNRIFKDTVNTMKGISLAMVEYVGEDEFRQFVGTLRKIREFQEQSDSFEAVDDPGREPFPCA